jgi:hypothetical protein
MSISLKMDSRLDWRMTEAAQRQASAVREREWTWMFAPVGGAKRIGCTPWLGGEMNL